MSNGKTDSSGITHWMGLLGIVVPVAASVYVAIEAGKTQSNISRIDLKVKNDGLLLEQQKLAMELEMRKEQLLEKQIPNLLSEDASRQAIGKALLFTVYPDEAKDILQRVVRAAGGNEAKMLQQATAQAEQVQAAASEWGIVVSADKDIAQAQPELQKAKRTAITPVQLYRRKEVYRVLLGNYPSRSLAEQTLLGVREATRGDAYVVNIRTWCSNGTAVKEGGVNVVHCQ